MTGNILRWVHFWLRNAERCFVLFRNPSFLSWAWENHHNDRGILFRARKLLSKRADEVHLCFGASDVHKQTVATLKSCYVYVPRHMKRCGHLSTWLPYSFRHNMMIDVYCAKNCSIQSQHRMRNYPVAKLKTETLMDDWGQLLHKPTNCWKLALVCVVYTCLVLNRYIIPVICVSNVIICV